jgi:hypothetical protein
VMPLCGEGGICRNVARVQPQKFLKKKRSLHSKNFSTQHNGE